MLTRCEFEVLSFLERTGEGARSLRQLSDELGFSCAAVGEALRALEGRGELRAEGERLALTEAGLAALEPYRVRKAIIVAAGFGSRMMPATADRPKPMVRVRGVRIIDTLLDALTAAGIRDIVIVGGYRGEKLRELLERHPFLRFLDNDRYESENNISSAMAALDEMRGGCYFCEADLYLSEPSLIRKYQYVSNILGSYSLETDDWCFRMEDGCVSDYRKGGTYCYNYYGISYWTAEDCDRLREDWAEVYAQPDGKELFWEFVPFVRKKERYRCEIRSCRKQDITEIDSYEELALLDPSYR